MMFGTLTLSERAALLRKMRNAVLTNRVEAEALISQPTAPSGITADQAMESLAECAGVVLAMYPDPEPVATPGPLGGLIDAFDAEADRMRRTMGQQA